MTHLKFAPLVVAVIGLLVIPGLGPDSGETAGAATYPRRSTLMGLAADSGDPRPAQTVTATAEPTDEPSATATAPPGEEPPYDPYYPAYPY